VTEHGREVAGAEQHLSSEIVVVWPILELAFLTLEIFIIVHQIRFSS
jgi:hypothetical protein